MNALSVRFMTVPFSEGRLRGAPRKRGPAPVVVSRCYGLRTPLLLRLEDAVHEELDRTCDQAGGTDGVRAGLGVDVEPVERGIGVKDRRGRGKAAHRQVPRLAADVDGVVAVRA